MIANDTNKTVGQRIKDYRKNRGMSQDDLSQGICSRQTISLLENDLHIPSIAIMEKLAERLGHTLQDILHDEVLSLETKLKVDLIQVYVEKGEFAAALNLIRQVELMEDTLEYQRRNIVLFKAECMTRLGKSHESINMLSNLQQELEQQRFADDRFLAVLYDKLGTAYYFVSNMANAYAYYMRAYQVSRRLPEFDIDAARITFNLGKALRMMDRPSEAVELLKESHSFFERSCDPNRLALTLFELGIAYQARNDFEAASVYIQESLAIYKSLNVLNMVRRVRESYAFTVLAKLDPKQAVEELLVCAREFEEEGDQLQLVYTYAKVSFLLLRSGEHDLAGTYIHNAMSLFNIEQAGDHLEYVTAVHAYAEYLLQVNDLTACIEFAYKASSLFDSMGLGRDAADSLKLAIQAYREQGLFELALGVAEEVNEILQRPLNNL